MNHLHRGTLLLILLGHFALGLHFGLLNPLGEAPDEADHWAYVVHIANTGTLPVGPAMTQAKHPPLFHLGAAILARLDDPDIDFFHPNPAVNLTPGDQYSPAFFLHDHEAPPWGGAIRAFHLARFWSLILTTLTVAVTAALARTAFVRVPWLVAASAGIVAFLPEFLFLGGALGNDTAAAFLGALSLWGVLAIYHSGGNLRRAWWTPLALGLGVMAKVSVLAIWPIAGLALLAGILAQTKDSFPATFRQQWRTLLVRGLLLYLPALAIITPWLWRNWQLYGDPMGMNMALLTIDQRATPWTWPDTEWLLRGWFFSGWGKFGGAGHIAMPDWFYWLAGLLLLGALAGCILWWWRAEWRTVRIPVLLLGLAPLGVAVSMWRYSLDALGTDQGRLLFPALAAMAVLLAGGLLHWVPQRYHGVASWAIIAFLSLSSAYGLWFVLLPALGQR